MRITVAQWTLQDWQGPTSNVRFRVTANNNFTARDDDNSGVEIDAGSYREVDCTVGTAVIEGVTVKTITIPSFWLFSTNDALLPIRTASYRAGFITKSGRELQQLQLLQNFQLFKELESVFSPVPWHEILRANYPAAPMPLDKETYSVSQILELIGSGVITKGVNAASPRVAFWSGPITVDGATGFEYQNADPMVKVVQQNATWNPFRVVENAGAANVKVGGNPALVSTHVVNEAGLSHRAIVNDAATRRWTEVAKDGALGLQYSAYDNSNVLQSNTIFDPAGGIGFSDSSAEFGYFYKASSAYHFGISAAVGASGATKEITFTTAGVGINKPTAIGAQLHAVSGANGRIGLLVESTAGATQPIATFSKGTSPRFTFNHDAVSTFGLASSVKGRLTFAVQTNALTQSIEGADTPASTIVYKLPAADPANGQLLRTVSFSGGVATLEWTNPVSGGDVSSDIGVVVDNKLARFNGTTGKLITDSAIVVADTTGAFTVPNTWSLNDANGNEVIKIGSNASAVSEFTFTNAASGGDVTLAASSDGANAGIVYSPKGTGLNQFTKNVLMNVGANALDNVIFINSQAAGAVNASFGFFVAGSGSSTATDGPYFFARGNNFSGFASDQKGAMLLVAGNVSTPTGNQGTIRFMTGNEVTRLTIKPDGSASILATDLLLSKDDPQITMTDTSGGTGSDFIIKRSGSTTNIGRSGQTDLSLNNTNGEYTFGVIPVGPNSDPTTGDQLTRKTYVDTRRIRWAVTFIYQDLSAKGVDSNFDQIPGALIPGSNFVCTHAFCKVASGALTGGAIITLRRQPFNNQTQTDIDGFNINPSGGDVTTLGVGVEHSITPFTFAANTFIYPVLTAQSASGAKMVWVGLRGYQTPENP
jgi:hypothetical protein